MEKSDKKSNEMISVMIDDSCMPSPIHVLKSIEIEYVVSGFGSQIINGIEYVVDKGDIIFLNAGDTQECHSTGNMKLIKCIVDSKLFDDKRELVASLPKVIHLKGKYIFSVEELLKKIKLEYKNKTSAYELCLTAYVNLLVTLLVRAQEEISIYRTDMKEKIENYINDNIDEVEMSDLAKRFNLSVSYFGELFKKIFNENFTSYIVKARMQKAFDLIVKTDLPIKEIIENVGYSDKKNFYRQFRKYADTTPKQLRDRAE